MTRSFARFSGRSQWPVSLGAGLALVCNLLLSAVAAEPEKLSDSALQQIRALEQEKLSRSATHRKLDSQFVFQLKQHRGQAIAEGVNQLRPNVKLARDGRILVDIDATVEQALLNKIIQSGGTVISSSAQYHSIRALVTLDQLEDLAASAGVKFIAPASEAHTHAGTVTSEGDATHRANFVRDNFGVTGRGIKVGVLSDSIDYLGGAQSTGNLGDVTVLPGQAGSGSGEGTAMLEIIHDLAPDAQLFFATAFNGEASFAQNILDLRSNGCDIIVDDIFYFVESPFQDGIIAQAVNTVTAGGALYFSSAGNEGNLKDNTSGTWEGNFVDGGAAAPPANIGGGRVHSFGAANFNSVIDSGFGIATLFWADPLGGSANDYDLFVLDSSGSYVVSSSLNTQDGTQDPYEAANISPGNRIVIVKVSGQARYLHLAATRGRLTVATAGATKGHSAAAAAFSVAAVNAGTSFPNAFSGGSANPVEAFSSDGPRRVFFNPDGTAITPGNFLASGGAIRPKPDITAADGVSTYVFGQFFGTSAAAPHAAAIAVLLKSLDHNFTPAQIRTALTTTSLDIEGSGVDSNSGAGIVMADAALLALPPRPFVVAGTAALVTESCPNGVLDAGETVSVSLTLSNLGTGGTTSLVATLLSSGGVTSPSGPQNYGALLATGGHASRTFAFTVAGSCGSTNVATLQLQDGTNNLGTISIPFQTGQLRVPLAENFDSITTPDLPPGWTSASTGPVSPWFTTTYPSDTSPNSAHAAGASFTVSDNSLTSPTVPIVTSNAQLTFRHSIYNYYYYGYAGGVLEISTNGGPFTDIIAAGGVFVTNGYNATLYTGYSNVLEGRSVWDGYTSYFVTSTVNLPGSAAGQNVRLRWRFGTGNYGSGDGWYVDSIRLTDGYACCSAVSNDVVLSMFDIPDPALAGGPITYLINILNTGPQTATNVSFTDVLPPGFDFKSMTISQGLPPDYQQNSGGTLSFSLGNLPGGSNVTIHILGSAATAGTLTNTVSVSRGGADGNPSNNTATVETTVFLPAISVSDVSVFEGDSGITNAVFSVSVSPTAYQPVSVAFATSNSTALAGADYVATNGVLVIPPGVTNVSIAVPVIGDTISEADETFTLELSNPTNAVLASAQGLGTIFNDDPLPKISIGDVAVTEGDIGTTNAVFAVGLSSPSGQTVSVYYNTTDGSAIAGSDYVGTGGYLEFAPGQTNQTISVVVNGDVAVETNETFTVTLYSPGNAKISRATGVGTIINDDGLPGQIHLFAWSAIASPQSNNLPFPVTLTAQDYFSNTVTGFAGPAALAGTGQIGTRTNSFFGSIVHAVTDNSGDYTYGYRFTPKTNLLVTHVRHYSGTKVSIWTDDGALLATKNVTSVPGTWVETPLSTPLQLLAGQTYRLGFYSASTTSYGRFDQASDYPDANLTQPVYRVGDGFPDLGDVIHFAFVDLRYTVPILVSVPISPIASGVFSNGVWNGNMAVGQPASNVTLVAGDGHGHVSASNPFDVAAVPGQVTRFVWNTIPSPQSNGAPFGVTVTAKDYFNNVASNFAGTVAIAGSALAGGFSSTVLDSPVQNHSGASQSTLGYSFTPSTDMLVTHVRHYFGTKVSIWTDGGTLLASQNVSSTPGTWKETPLSSPLPLSAGVTYRIAAYNSSGSYYYRLDLPDFSPSITINQSYHGFGDSFPAIADSSRWWFVDFRYLVGAAPGPVFISPTNSGSFATGVWTGNVAVLQAATNTLLFADDGFTHTGLSGTFNVLPAAGQITHFVWNAIPSPQLIGEPFAVTVTAKDYLNLTASNYAGGAALSGFAVSLGATNILLFEDAVVAHTFNTALIELGRPFQAFSNDTEAAFYTAVAAANPSNTLVIVDATSYSHDFTSVATFVGGGGRAILEYWDLDSVPSIATAFNAAVQSDVFTPLPLYDWGGSQFFAGLPNPIIFVETGWNDDGDRLSPIVGGVAVAGFVASPTTAQAALILGNSNRTILNGFLMDNAQSFSNAVLLAKHEVQALLGTTAPLPINPTNTGIFSNGVWSGPLAVLQAATNAMLRADGGFGWVGTSAGFDVLNTPKLAIAYDGNYQELSWTAAAVGFQLEQSPVLLPAPIWTPATNVPVFVNGRWVVTNTAPGVMFYRLHKP